VIASGCARTGTVQSIFIGGIGERLQNYWVIRHSVIVDAPEINKLSLFMQDVGPIHKF